MKKIIIILIVILSSTYVLWDSIYFKCIEAGGINPYSKNVSLRKSPKLSSTIVGHLEAKSFYKLKENSTKYNHYYVLKEGLHIRKKDFTLGYLKICNTFIVKTSIFKSYEKDLYKILPWLLVLLTSVLFILVGFGVYIKSRQKKKLTLHKMEDISTNQAVAIEEVPLYNEIHEQEKRELKNKVYSLSNNINKLTEGHNTLKIENESLQNNLVKMEINNDKKEELLKAKQILSKYSKEEMKKIETRFYHKAKKEIEAVYKNDINEMEVHTNNLENKYNEAYKNALKLGIDLENSNISGLVKGRQFEIFAAKIWHKDSRTTIEDWTSDKGIYEKIKVATNTNPDFIISFNNTDRKVAVECKYRGEFKGDKKYTNFDSRKKVENYKSFQSKNIIDVYILLGIGGNAKSPISLYLVPLNDIAKITIRDDQYGQVTTVKEKIAPYQINSNQLVEYLNK